MQKELPLTLSLSPCVHGARGDEGEASGWKKVLSLYIYSQRVKGLDVFLKIRRFF
jgi:hypothetical protein